MLGAQGLHTLKQLLAGTFHRKAARRVDAAHAPVGGHGALGVPDEHAAHGGHQADEGDEPEHLAPVEHALGAHPTAQQDAREHGGLAGGAPRREHAGARDVAAVAHVCKHEQHKQRKRHVGELDEERHDKPRLLGHQGDERERHHRHRQGDPGQVAHVNVARARDEGHEQKGPEERGGHHAVHRADPVDVHEKRPRKARGEAGQGHEHDELPGHGVRDGPLARNEWVARLPADIAAHATRHAPNALARQARQRDGRHDAREQGQQGHGHARGPVSHVGDDERHGPGDQAAQGAEQKAARGAELDVCLGPKQEEHRPAYGAGRRERHKQGEGHPGQHGQAGKGERAHRAQRDGTHAQRTVRGDRPEPAAQGGHRHEEADVAHAHAIVHGHLARRAVAGIDEHVRQVRAAQPRHEDAQPDERPGQEGHPATLLLRAEAGEKLGQPAGRPWSGGRFRGGLACRRAVRWHGAPLAR